MEQVRPVIQNDSSRKGDNTFVGTCLTMCPMEEMESRTLHRELSIFERVDGGAYAADPQRAVKKYLNPNYANLLPPPRLVRPARVLAKTMEHLKVVCDSTTVPFPVVHDFVQNRTRSIRLDFFLQRIKDDICVRVFEEIVRFHILSTHKLHGTVTAPFLRARNLEQLHQCLVSLREIYTERRSLGGTSSKNESEMQAYYLLLHAWDEKTLSNVCSSLPREIFRSKQVQLAVQIAKMVATNIMNYVAYFKAVRKAPYLVACLMQINFAKVRAHAIKTIVHAYAPEGSKAGPFPLGPLQGMLCFASAEDVIKFCKQYGLSVTKSSAARREHIAREEGGSALIDSKIARFTTSQILSRAGIDLNANEADADAAAHPRAGGSNQSNMQLSPKGSEKIESIASQQTSLSKSNTNPKVGPTERVTNPEDKEKNLLCTSASGAEKDGDAQGQLAPSVSNMTHTPRISPDPHSQDIFPKDSASQSEGQSELQAVRDHSASNLLRISGPAVGFHRAIENEISKVDKVPPPQRLPRRSAPEEDQEVCEHGSEIYRNATSAERDALPTTTPGQAIVQDDQAGETRSGEERLRKEKEQDDVTLEQLSKYEAEFKEVNAMVIRVQKEIAKVPDPKRFPRNVLNEIYDLAMLVVQSSLTLNALQENVTRLNPIIADVEEEQENLELLIVQAALVNRQLWDQLWRIRASAKLELLQRGELLGTPVDHEEQQRAYERNKKPSIKVSATKKHSPHSNSRTRRQSRPAADPGPSTRNLQPAETTSQHPQSHAGQGARGSEVRTSVRRELQFEQIDDVEDCVTVRYPCSEETASTANPLNAEAIAAALRDNDRKRRLSNSDDGTADLKRPKRRGTISLDDLVERSIPTPVIEIYEDIQKDALKKEKEELVRALSHIWEEHGQRIDMDIRMIAREMRIQQLQQNANLENR